MNATAAAYQAASRPLSAVLDAVPPGAWGNPSPCGEWAARDVVEHLVTTQRDLMTKHGASLGPAPDPTSDPAAAFQAHSAEVLSLVSDDALADLGYDGFFGPTTVGATLVQFYVWDMIVHRWDVARATGGDGALTPEELDRTEAGADGFGEALHMDGVCGPEVPAPAGADRQTRVLARLGRTA